MSANSSYSETYARYQPLAEAETDAYSFYCRARNDGISAFYALLLARDCFGIELVDGLKFKTAYEGYRNDELLKKSERTKPERGVFCPKCKCNIPAFQSVPPVVEYEIRSMGNSSERMSRLIEITGCPKTWAKIWSSHPDGPHRIFGHFDAPPCPHCGSQLRTKMARQCVECGADWH